MSPYFEFLIEWATECGAGLLLAALSLLVHLPLILLAMPVVIVFLGIANLEELHAAWYGMLSTVGIFDPAVLMNAEREIYAKCRHYFRFGDVASAAVPAQIVDPETA
jgi:hypothetical protein